MASITVDISRARRKVRRIDVCHERAKRKATAEGAKLLATLLRKRSRRLSGKMRRHIKPVRTRSGGATVAIDRRPFKRFFYPKLYKHEFRRWARRYRPTIAKTMKVVYERNFNSCMASGVGGRRAA